MVNHIIIKMSEESYFWEANEASDSVAVWGMGCMSPAVCKLRKNAKMLELVGVCCCPSQFLL